MSRILYTLALFMLPGCTGLKVDGACSYVRETKMTYQCEAGGAVEHYRIAPVQPD